MIVRFRTKPYAKKVVLRRGELSAYALFFAALAMSFPNVSSASSSTTTFNSNKGANSARLKSMREIRDENLIRQEFDFSCGAAALATLMRFGFSDPVTEQQIVADLFEGLGQAETATREREGFSLFDLQQVAKKRGYKAEGFRLEPQSLAQLNGPVIVFLDTMGYKHFAVLKGVRGDRVYLADPSRGNIRMPAYRFLQAWMRNGAGIVFVVEPKDGLLEMNDALRPPATGLIQPEIIGVRELLAVRAPFSPYQ